jgi:hypothetical protein
MIAAIVSQQARINFDALAVHRSARCSRFELALSLAARFMRLSLFVLGEHEIVDLVLSLIANLRLWWIVALWNMLRQVCRKHFPELANCNGAVASALCSGLE